MPKINRNHFTAVVVLVATLGSLLAIRYFTRELVNRGPAATLSVFEPHAGGCAWTRIEPIRNIEDSLATFHSDCDGVRVAWSPSLDKAIVWFGTDQDNATVYLTDMDEKTPTELPLPTDSDVDSFALAPRNQALAFTMTMEPVVNRDDAGMFIEFHGKRYPVLAEGDGIDVLAHTFALDGKKWELTETVASRCCSDTAPGISLLRSYKNHVESDRAATLQSGQILAWTPEYTPVTDEAVTKLLDAELPEDFDRSTGIWGKIATSEKLARIDAIDAIDVIDVIVWFIGASAGDTNPNASNSEAGGFASIYASGHARFLNRKTGQLTAPPNAILSAKDQASYQIYESYLLVTEAGSGMQPRLYDLKKGTLAWSSDLAQGVVFWPLISESR